MPGKLSVNIPQIVHETIDGETILIHLGTGAYYSLDGLGAEVWALAELGISGEEVIAALQARYQAEPELVAVAVGGFLEQLLAEGLMAEVAAEEAHEPRVLGVEPVPAASADFSTPVLNKYTDMQEFMLVDPIHDVEEAAGWPHVKAG